MARVPIGRLLVGMSHSEYLGSAKAGPAICRPMGSEFCEKPQGMEMAGVPKRLKADVLLGGRW